MALREDSDDGHDPGPGSGDGGPARRPPVTAVVVDSHAVVREGLTMLLAPEGVDVLATAGTGDGGEALIRHHAPAVALIALDLPDLDGIVLLRRLVAGGSPTAVVLYTPGEDAEQAAVAVHAGAAGVVATRRPVAELAAALRAVAAGRLWFDEPGEPSPLPHRADELLTELRNRRTGTLSEAELRVLALVARGSSTEAMAEALSLSPHTVRTHLRNVMRKLGASSRAHAVAIAIRESAIEA